MEKAENKVIVWSIDDFNTLGLMRELGSAALDLLFLVKGSAGMAVKSKYCRNYVETATIEDGRSYLFEHFSGEEKKPILIIASDDIITYVDRHKDDFEKHFIVPGTTVKGNVEKYIDKNTMTALAEELGILCPKSRAVKKGDDLRGIEFPCLIKPSHQKPGHYNEFKFKICKNEQALKRTMRYVRPDSEFILQQYIPKELDLLVYGARMWDGKTVFAGGFVRDRWADSGSSSHGFISENIPACADTEKICRFLERIDYHGLFSVEYGLLKDKAYFFEVNLRNDGTSHYFYQAGANLPLAYVYSAAGLDYSQIPVKVTGKQWFIDELFDKENVLMGNVKKSVWKKDMEEATLFKYYDKDDPAPYEFAKKGKNKQILQDIVLKRFRLYIVFVLDKLGLRK